MTIEVLDTGINRNNAEFPGRISPDSTDFEQRLARCGTGPARRCRRTPSTNGRATGGRSPRDEVLAALAELFATRGPPAQIRSDNGPEFIATAVQEWLAKVGVKTLYIAPGSPWESGSEPFNGPLRDEILNGEISLAP